MCRISVLMSVYIKENAENLIEAFESVFNQTLEPDEVVIVEDGPLTTELYSVLDDFQKKYSSLRRVTLKNNVGLGLALNEGLQHCSNELVARMDTDDIALSDRFEKQCRFMAQHPEIAVVGGQISEFIGEPVNIVGYRKVPLSPQDCKKYYRDRDPLNHMTVMMRKSALMDAGNYKPWHLDEDSYLWGRILKKGYLLANLPDILVNVRVGEEMYARRGGWKYFKSDTKMLKWKLDHGLTSYGRYIYNCIIRFGVQVVLPNKLRGLVFKKLLRSRH